MIIAFVDVAYASRHACAACVVTDAWESAPTRCPLHVRGASGNPLFITAVGMTPEVPARRVRALAGKHRIPDIVRIVDELARGRAPAAPR